ncbi:uncharacterized protein PV09_08605 [Verruconis gallopava]|uniref:Asteroid domain-containing protein n=1 Tax=Verruconis gallopava TaxID=253628 RepID=A0A0D1YG86_9PEZI|nr:uncharacterized protein PV09_08605 [Verruconis gallopava]KIV99801.1 hypothetical protein PV09_08605 [Verruconis gallopava]
MGIRGLLHLLQPYRVALEFPLLPQAVVAAADDDADVQASADATHSRPGAVRLELADQDDSDGFALSKDAVRNHRDSYSGRSRPSLSPPLASSRSSFPDPDPDPSTAHPAQHQHSDLSSVTNAVDGAVYAVVDGPALAYHAYHVALSGRRLAENALDALPTYDEVGRIATDLLDTLQAHGIRVAVIFFDGALPEPKRDVRIQRLSAYLRQLEHYRSVHSFHFGPMSDCSIVDRLASAAVDTPATAPLTGSDEGADDRSKRSAEINRHKNDETNYNDDGNRTRKQNNRGSTPSTPCFSPAQVPAKLKLLPALPFLVPSIIETLHKTAYAGRAVVVPGEADSFCAAYAKDREAMIVTSDSDLLIYDLGPHGSVALLKDIEHQSAASSNGAERRSCLRVMRYEPASMARRFGLKTLDTLAFALHEDPHKSFSTCLQRARCLQSDPSLAYLEFAASYAAANAASALANVAVGAAPLRGLDPRVSEWVRDGQDLGLLRLPPEVRALLVAKTASAPARMYLPVLIEDASRSSAWDVGADVRTLAYSVFRPARPSAACSTKEVVRRGNRIVETSVQHLDLPSVLEMLGHFQALVKHLHSLDVSRRLVWPLIALYMMCSHLQRDGRKLPSAAMLNALLVRRRPYRNWEHVQWSAQMQAAAYSLRMLHQCLDLGMLSPHSSSGCDVTAAIETTTELLRTLPSLASWFDEDVLVDDAAIDQAVRMLLDALGVDTADRTCADEQLTGKQRKKKRKKERAAAKAAQTGDMGTNVSLPNMFSLLATGSLGNDA